MADQKNEDRESKSSDYQPPKGAASDNSLRAGGSSISYKASADWLILRKKEKPKAEMFHVSYIAEGDGSRPITFVFNGGPGASSVYLHLGAMGPRRAVFGEHGESVDPPARLADNEHSWLAFTDLVFIDPIGTGFSRMIEDEKEKKEDKAGEGTSPKARNTGSSNAIWNPWESLSPNTCPNTSAGRVPYTSPERATAVSARRSSPNCSSRTTEWASTGR
jgi:carboxypeptidase C (cathepsin A)